MENRLTLIQDYCNRRNIKLSAQQELVLATIGNNPQALTITQILGVLAADNPKANRMTVHRAVEYLASLGLIHKISLNHTYALCSNLNQFHQQSCQLLVCQKCGSQQEIHSHKICEVLAETSQLFNFAFASPLEITGICSKCQTKLEEN